MTGDFKERLSEIVKSPNSVELVEYELSEALREQGVTPAVYPVLTDEATQAIIDLIVELEQGLKEQKRSLLDIDTNSLVETKRGKEHPIIEAIPIDKLDELINKLRGSKNG